MEWLHFARPTSQPMSCLQIYIYLDDKFTQKQWKMKTGYGGEHPNIYMCQGLNSHYFHIIGDGHQPNSRGYIPIIRIPIKGGMTIPNIATFDHGTYAYPIRILECIYRVHRSFHVVYIYLRICACCIYLSTDSCIKFIHPPIITYPSILSTSELCGMG